MISREFNRKSLQDKIAAKIASIDLIANELPGVIIIHNIKTSCVEYMSPRGQEHLEVTLDELKEIGPAYHTLFFNPEDSKDYVPKLFELVERNDENKIYSFFQQVSKAGKKKYTWYFSTIKLFMKDDDGNPLLTITMAYPIDPLHHITSKVSRLLEENNFLKKHHHNFNQLTKREREILKLTVIGKSSADLATILHISKNTAETHRRNIKKKLNAESLYDLSLYARAFDLI